MAEPDPNLTWDALWKSENQAEKVLYARELLAWIGKGGSPPSIRGDARVDQYITVATCTAIVSDGSPKGIV